MVLYRSHAMVGKNSDVRTRVPVQRQLKYLLQLACIPLQSPAQQFLLVTVVMQEGIHLTEIQKQKACRVCLEILLGLSKNLFVRKCVVGIDAVRDISLRELVKNRNRARNSSPLVNFMLLDPVEPWQQSEADDTFKHWSHSQEPSPHLFQELSCYT